MEISEIKLIKLDLCKTDMQTLSKGEALRFQHNGMDFELVGSAIQTEPEIPQPVIQPVKRERKPAPIKKLEAEALGRKELTRRRRGVLARNIFAECLVELPKEFSIKQLGEAAKKKNIYSFLKPISLRQSARNFISKWLKEGLIAEAGKGQYRKVAQRGQKEAVQEELPENFRNFKKSHRSGDTVQCSTKGLNVNYVECRGCRYRVREEGDIIFCDLKIYESGGM